MPRSTRLLALAAALSLLTITGCGSDSSEPGTTIASEPSAPDATPATTRDILYATRTDRELPLRLDMTVPPDPKDAPVVVYLPGLDGSTASWMGEAFAAEGAFFFSVDYPRSGPPVPFMENGYGARGMADSVACAIRYSRALAAELGSEDPVVVLSGFSLGGAPAAHVALLGDTLEAAWEEFAVNGGPPGQVDCQITGGSTHVDVLVGMSGAYDMFAPIYDGKWGRAYQQENHPGLQEFLAAIGANADLEIRLLHGEDDGWIPFENSTEFSTALDAAGYDVQVIGFEGGHAEPPRELLVSVVMDAVRP